MLRPVLSLLLLAPFAAAADNPETLVENSQARARVVLDQAVTAIGGAEALNAIKSVKLELQGETWPRLQMPTPSAPFEAGTFKETLLFDFTGNRLKLEQHNTGAGFEGHNAIVLANGQGTNYDLRNSIATPIPAAQATGQQFIQYYRRIPNLILRQALGRQNSLRHLGEENYDGRRHEVITFVMPDTQQVALYVDAGTHLISKYELNFTDPLTGEEASEVLFGDYAQVGALKAPRSWSFRQAGDIVARYAAKVTFDPPLNDDSFKVDDTRMTKVQAQPDGPAQSVEKLADGVYLVQNVAGPNQNTLAVAFEDYILAVEAPGSSAGADAVIARIKETIPGKPIKYLAMTHHHGDHIGGLRGFIAEGATVVTTPGNREVVRTMAGAPQNDRLAKSPREPQVLLLENGKRVFTDGKRTVELHDIGPNPHAREMLVAWLPQEGIVFQGDLFGLPNNGAPVGPPQVSTAHFARTLRQSGWKVQRIASVHGPTATIEQFNQATAAVK